MAHWLKLRPILVMCLLLLAPMAALAHLILTWAPSELAVNRLVSSIEDSGCLVRQQWEQLERLRAETSRLQDAAASLHGSPQRWLPERQHHLISNKLAGTLQGDGVRLERLAFDEPALYAAAPQAGVLACEEVSVVCRGPYAGLAVALDRLATLGLPMRVTDLSWRRAEQDIELTLQMQIPFAPDASLAAALREAAGWEEEEDEL